jgi:hypothetical protein
MIISKNNAIRKYIPSTLLSIEELLFLSTTPGAVYTEGFAHIGIEKYQRAQ